MTLRRLSLLFTVLSLLSTAPALAGGKADWRDYAWRTIPLAQCQDRGRTVTCPPYHQRWDWKRNQWADVTLTIAGTTLRLTQALTNRDTRDDDFVCVTALVVDAAGATLIAHHQNWHMDPGQTLAREFSYQSRRLPDAYAIHIGSKQCRRGAGQDDAVLAKVQAGISR